MVQIDMMKHKYVLIPDRNVFIIENELYYHLLQYVNEIFVLKMVFRYFKTDDKINLTKEKRFWPSNLLLQAVLP